MKIAVIGTGNIGGRLAKVWASKGHHIFLGTRDKAQTKIQTLIATNPGLIKALNPAEAVKEAEVILLAIPASIAYQSVKDLGDIKNKIIIDAMNAVFRKPEPFNKTSEAIFKASGNDHIVKCFNSIGAENMDNPYYGNEVADMLIAGNYEADKAVVKKLAEEIGFNVYDLGKLDKEAMLEQMAAVWGTLAFGTGLGRNIAFKILRR